MTCKTEIESFWPRLPGSNIDFQVESLALLACFFSKKTQRTVKKKKTKIQVSGTRRAFKRISRIFVQPEQGSRASFFGLQRKSFKIEKLTILWLGYGLGV